MIKVVFICHGNICRSPMAEYVMKDLVYKAGLATDFYIESAATTNEERGNDIHPNTKYELRNHDVPYGKHAAHKIKPEEYDYFDYIIAMDYENLAHLKRIFGDDKDGKIHLLMDFTDKKGVVADPWYTGDFEATWNDIYQGCTSLLKHLQKTFF